MIILLLLCADLGIAWDPDLGAEAEEAGLVSAVSRVASSAMNTVVAGLQGSAPSVRLYVHTSEHYRARFGEAVADSWWAHYDRGEVHVNAGVPIDGRFAGLLAHEMTHAVFDRDRLSFRLPLWLNEGVAEYFSYDMRGRRGVDDVQRTYLRDACRDGVKTLPSSGKLNATGYLLSYAMVTFMRETYQARAPFTMATRMLSGDSIDAAAQAATGASFSAMQAAYFKWVCRFD